MSAPTDTTLTLGDLHRGLRGGLGETAPCRVVLTFEQRTTLAPKSADGETTPGLLTKRAFKAEIDFDSDGLSRAELQSTGMTTTAHANVAFVRDGDGYLYSIDGSRHGRYHSTPDLFDVHSFEEMLDFVTVTDVTIDRTRGPSGRSMSEYDVELDSEAFQRLLRAFGAETGEPPEDLELTSYNVHLAAAGDVVVDYWWQLSGDERIENEEGELDTYGCRVTCHVTLRLVGLTEVPSVAVTVDETLPALGKVDDVWAAARAAQGFGTPPWA